MMPERDRPAVEITPEMRRAGAIALEEYGESYDQETLAEAVYIAMAMRASCRREKSYDSRQSRKGGQ